MKKILIAIKDDFTRKLYSKILIDEKFEVLETNNGREAQGLARKELPDIILADVELAEMGGFELLESLKKEPLTQRIPIAVFTQLEREGDRVKAIELEAKDFIVGTFMSPRQVVLRIKTHLGMERSYRIEINHESKEVQELASDLGESTILLCPKCQSSLQLFLIRDFSKGKNYFKVSFTCPKCFKTV